jgi:4-hydroxybenzoate polyprenyltransferase
MKNYKKWIESLRLSVTIFAGLLVHVGFKIAHSPTDWVLVIEVFFIASFAMIQNDYVDRTHDLKKGKRLAYDNPKLFRIILISGWFLITITALTLLIEYCLFLMPGIIVSMLYSYSRKVPYLQTSCVAFASATPLIMPLNHGIPWPIPVQNLFIFISVLLAIFGREIIKDIEDAEIDVGWKFTPLSLKRQSKEEMMMLAGTCIGLASTFCFYFVFGIAAEQMGTAFKFISIGGLACVSFSSRLLVIEHELKPGKSFFDAGMMLFVGSLVIY